MVVSPVGLKVHDGSSTTELSIARVKNSHAQASPSYSAFLTAKDDFYSTSIHFKGSSSKPPSHLGNNIAFEYLAGGSLTPKTLKRMKLEKGAILSTTLATMYLLVPDSAKQKDSSNISPLREAYKAEYRRLKQSGVADPNRRLLVQGAAAAAALLLLMPLAPVKASNGAEEIAALDEKMRRILTKYFNEQLPTTDLRRGEADLAIHTIYESVYLRDWLRLTPEIRAALTLFYGTAMQPAIDPLLVSTDPNQVPKTTITYRDGEVRNNRPQYTLIFNGDASSSFFEGDQSSQVARVTGGLNNATTDNDRSDDFIERRIVLNPRLRPTIGQLISDSFDDEKTLTYLLHEAATLGHELGAHTDLVTDLNLSDRVISGEEPNPVNSLGEEVFGNFLTARFVGSAAPQGFRTDVRNVALAREHREIIDIYKNGNYDQFMTEIANRYATDSLAEDSPFSNVPLQILQGVTPPEVITATPEASQLNSPGITFSHPAVTEVLHRLIPGSSTAA